MEIIPASSRLFILSGSIEIFVVGLRAGAGMVDAAVTTI